MRRWPEFSKRKWVGLTLSAVFIPLALLLFLQYRWLSHLAEASAVADNARLMNYLEAVVEKSDDFYKDQVRKALVFPDDYFEEPSSPKLIRRFKQDTPLGAKLLFATVYRERGRDISVVYDPRTRKATMPDDPAMKRAIQVATAPWKVLAAKGVCVTSTTPSVEERYPDNRIVTLPISLGEECRVVGVAGIVVDRDYFVENVLRDAIDEALPRFLTDDERWGVTVRDEKGRLVIGERNPTPVSEDEVSREFPLVFSDWSITLQNPRRTPEQVAKANFTLNLSMSVLLALALVGGVLWTVRMVSRELRLSQMKSDFVSNVSHELRTPLASIRVFAEFLRTGRVGDLAKAQEYGAYIETESRRLTGLVDNILDFSRIESGAKTYDLTTGDLRQVVSETVRSLQTSLDHRGITLGFDEVGEDFPMLDFDAGAVRQAIANLVDNAVKYSDGKPVTVTFARRDGAIVIDVRDRGIGISAEEQGKIFDRFHRVHTGLVHDVKGAGLGLSIVSHIMQAHGGRVGVESVRGEGSCFSLIFPLAKRARSVASAGDASSEGALA